MAAGSRPGNLPVAELDPPFLSGDAASASHREPPRPPLLLQRPDQVDRTRGLLLLQSRTSGRGARLRSPNRFCHLWLTACPGRGPLGRKERSSSPRRVDRARSGPPRGSPSPIGGSDLFRWPGSSSSVISRTSRVCLRDRRLDDQPGPLGFLPVECGGGSVRARACGIQLIEERLHGAQRLS